MLQCWLLSNGKLSPAAEAEANVRVFVRPDERERRELLERWQIDEHTLTSSLDANELARLEFEADHVALIFKRPCNYSSEERFLFKVSSCGMFVYPDAMLIVLPDDATLFSGRLFARVGSLPELMLKCIFASIHHFLEHLRVINAVSEALEEQIHAAVDNKYLLNLFSLEKSLVYYLNAINSNGKLIERMKLNAPKLGLSGELVELLDDLLIENSQCKEQAEIYSNILAGLMDARVSIVSNNLNLLIKALTVITIAIMLPTFVVSLFSMNVPIPFQERQWSFWGVLVLALASIGAVKLFLLWKRW